MTRYVFLSAVFFWSSFATMDLQFFPSLKLEASSSFLSSRETPQQLFELEPRASIFVVARTKWVKRQILNKPSLEGNVHLKGK